MGRWARVQRRGTRAKGPAKCPLEWAYVGCSQNYGPRLAIDYVTASNIGGVPRWDPNFGNTHVYFPVTSAEGGDNTG